MKKLIILLIILLLTGCTSYTELNDLSIVNTLGIDYKDNKYIIKLNIIESDKITTYTSKNKDFNKALNNIYQTTNKRLYLSHIDLLILTDNAINKKLDTILNNFLENNEYRNNFQTVIMNSKSFNSFFKQKLESKDITDLININSKETSICFKKELEVFLKEILTDNNSYLPTITFKNNKLYLDGYTLIQDKQVYEKLSIKKSIMLNLLTTNTNNSYIDKIKIVNSKVKIKTNKNNINIKINITSNTSSKKKLNNLKYDLLSFLEEYKKKDYDILKIKELIIKNDYKYYIRHEDLLSNITYIISLNNTKQDITINGGINNE